MGKGKRGETLNVFLGGGRRRGQEKKLNVWRGKSSNRLSWYVFLIWFVVLLMQLQQNKFSVPIFTCLQKYWTICITCYNGNLSCDIFNERCFPHHSQLHSLKSSLQCCVRSKQADEKSCHKFTPRIDHWMTAPDRHVTCTREGVSISLLLLCY